MRILLMIDLLHELNNTQTRKPFEMRSDKGAEFIKGVIELLLVDSDIIHATTSSYTPH